jgi:enamine deaminase RidA (YjgF/YER057c/UK114 family)
MSRPPVQQTCAIPFVEDEELASFASGTDGRTSMQAIEDVWAKLVADHAEHLALYGVGIPERLVVKSSGLPCKTALQLVVLRQFMGRAIHKNQVSRFIQRWYPKHGDTQVRHLAAQQGWNVLCKGDRYHGKIRLPDGYHVLVSTQTPKIAWQQRRGGLLGATDWDDLLERYGHRCATCGAADKQKHPLHDQKVRLERGHKDPHGDDGLGNTIPQCQFCNRAYRNKVVFDDEGRVTALASPDLVLASTPEVIREIFRVLGEQFAARL